MEFSKYDWDLKALLQGKTLEEFFLIWEKKVDNAISAYKNGECFKTLNEFSHYMQISDELSLASNRIFNYVTNKQNENLSDGTMLGWKQRLVYKWSQLEIALANFTNDVIKFKADIQKYLEHPNLKKYMRIFTLIFRAKSHTLKKSENQLLATLSPAFSASEEIYQILSGADLKYPDILDSKRKRHHINDIADINNFLKSSDRLLRKNTFVAFASAYKNLENSFAQTLYSHYLTCNLSAQVHHFDDYIAKTAFDDEINVDFIPFVYKCVNKYAPIYQVYQKELKKNYRHFLKLKKVEPWDLSFPLFSVKHKYSIEETMQIVKEALRPLGDEYIKNVQRAFDERWISWLPKPSKVTGAYSIAGTKGLDKFYILMNFDGTIDSVHTIAHELGHSMHSLAFNHQPVHAESEIFFAEVSSITNEVLLSEYLLKKYADDPRTTLYILQEFISNFFATTTRQIIFSDFEFSVINLLKQKQPVNAQIFKKIYAEKIVQYCGYDAKYLTKMLKNKYAYLNLSHIFRISHFYSDVFYVYKYAIGQVAALINAKNILTNGNLSLELFQKFLASGNSLPPLETIELLGINLKESKVWETVGTIMEDYVKKFVQLSHEYRKQR